MQISPNLQKECKLVAFQRNALNLVTWILLNEDLRRSILKRTQSNPSALREMLHLEDT